MGNFVTRATCIVETITGWGSGITAKHIYLKMKIKSNHVGAHLKYQTKHI